MNKEWDEAEKRAVLKKRARALTRESGKTGAARESLDIIEFRLSSETYALEFQYIREVHPLKSYTPVPSTPPFVLGIVNLRGQILSVIDLKKLFGLPEKGLGDANKVIVIGDDRMEFGVLADAVIGARAIPLATIQPPIPTRTEIGEGYVKGIAEARVIVLDAKRILGDASIVICHTTD